MATENREVAEIIFHNRETGEAINMGQTVSMSMEAREAEPEPIGATEGNVLGGTINLRMEQNRESRSIAMGTMERQFMEKQEPEREIRSFSRGNWDLYGQTWLGGPDMIMRTGTIQATQLNVDSLRESQLNTEGGSIQADTITGGTLTSVNISPDLTGPNEPRLISTMDELDMIGELPAEGLRAENIRYEELEPIEAPVDGQWRTGEGLGEWSNTTIYAMDGEVLPEPVEITFANGSVIRNTLGEQPLLFDRDGDVEDSPTLPSSYMGDASDIVERINQAPVTEPLMATHIDLNGHVTFSDLSTNTSESEEYTSLSTERIMNETIEAVRRACQPFVGREVPEVMAKVSAVASEAGTFIAVPGEDFEEWRAEDNDWVSQGIYENETGYGVFHKGCWFFGDAMDILEGKTIHNATLKIKKCFSVGGGDTKAYIVGHPHNDMPTTEPYITKVSVLKHIASEELNYVYVDLEPFKELISKGLIKGFGVYTEESGITEFASFDSEAEIDITWY